MKNEQCNKVSDINLNFIKFGLVLFWCLWFSLAFLTNLFDYLNATIGLPANWKFRSGNYQEVLKVLSIYQTPSIISNILFCLNILAQGASAFCFAIASYCFITRHPNTFFWINLSFALSMALWANFILLQEIFVTYQYAPTHIRLLMFELVTLVAVYLLPNKQPANASLIGDSHS